VTIGRVIALAFAGALVAVFALPLNGRRSEEPGEKRFSEWSPVRASKAANPRAGDSRGRAIEGRKRSRGGERRLVLHI